MIFKRKRANLMADKKRKTDMLRSAVENLDSTQRAIGEKLLTRLDFMELTLDDLQDTINRIGAVIKDTNGNGFEVFQEHPATRSYNTMIGKYNALIKTVIDLLPKETAQSDELMDFIKR